MARYAYPIVGGPLDGKHALVADFAREYNGGRPEWYTPAGCYAEYRNDYCRFNYASGPQMTTMVFVHTSLLKPPMTERTLQKERQHED